MLVNFLNKQQKLVNESNDLINSNHFIIDYLFKILVGLST